MKTATTNVTTIYSRYKTMRYLNQLTRRYTAFPNFINMLHPRTNYIPTLPVNLSMSISLRAGIELKKLADTYDECKRMVNDPRRAYRI